MYKEIIVTTTTEGSDFIADAFFSIGVSGVKIDDPNDINYVIANKASWDYIDDKLLDITDKTVKVSGFVSADELEDKLLELQGLLDDIDYVDLGTREITIVDYLQDDWQAEWKKHYKPIHVAPFVVVPKWIDYPPADKETIVKINPTMAFGTGEHESTRLCLGLMANLDFKDKYVLDIGTGSGILGIAANKLGSKFVHMCDIDSVAVASARENATLNSVDKDISITIGSADTCSFSADIVLANLTADILIMLADDISTNLKKGGMLISSGIIHARKEEVIKRYNSYGFVLKEAKAMGEWNALLFQKS